MIRVGKGNGFDTGSQLRRTYNIGLAHNAGHLNHNFQGSTMRRSSIDSISKGASMDGVITECQETIRFCSCKFRTH